LFAQSKLIQTGLHEIVPLVKEKVFLAGNCE